MTKYHKELNEVADHINAADYLIYEIAINRRNGNYCIDTYEESKFHGTMFVGTFQEVKKFLIGLRNGLFYMKPF